MSLDQDRANAFIARLQGKSVGKPVKKKTTQERFREEAPKRIRKNPQYGNTPMESRLAEVEGGVDYVPTGNPATRYMRMVNVAENERRRKMNVAYRNQWQRPLPVADIYSSNMGTDFYPNRKIRAKLENDRSTPSNAISAGSGRTARDVRDSKDYFKRTGQQRPEALKIQQQREHATIKPTR